MFDIFHRKENIFLDVFTCVPDFVNTVPITSSMNFLPNWYKQLESKVLDQGFEKSTLKTCPGINDLFKSGFIIPCWQDLLVETKNNEIRSLPENTSESHPSSQWGNALNGFSHLKIISPWRIKEKTGVKFLFTNTFWQDIHNNFIMPNGSLEFKYQHNTNINILVNESVSYKSFKIPVGSPLVQLVPLSDKNIKLKHHIISEQDFVQKFNLPQYSFTGNYYKRKKLLEKTDD